MKQSFAGLVVVAMIFVAAPAMAAGAAVPKNLCIDFDHFGDVIQLVVKPVGTLKTVDGTIKSYGLFGHSYNGVDIPVGGAGYVLHSQTIFHASFTGNARFGATPFTGGYELVFDLDPAVNTGTIYYFFHEANTTIISGSDTVTPVDCATLSVPALTNGEPRFTSDDR